MDSAHRPQTLSHPAEQLLRSGEPVAVAVALIMAIVVAPLFEEILFRVVLQGWLEAVWSRWRRESRSLRSPLVSWLPVLLPAILFALMHRRGSSAFETDYLVLLFAVQITVDLVALGLAIAFLRFISRATAMDLGLNPREFPSDIRLGMLSLFAITPPVMAIHMAMLNLITASGVDYALDQVPLLLLAMALGVLYQRTHRLAPCLVLHMAFNSVSVVLLLVAK